MWRTPTTLRSSLVRGWCDASTGRLLTLSGRSVSQLLRRSVVSHAESHAREASPSSLQERATQLKLGLHAADLVFVPTLACSGTRMPALVARTSSILALQRRQCTSPLVAGLVRRSNRGRAGLTPKPHHARQPLVGLRGSFRLRLASTFNHRPARSPALNLAQ